MSSSGRRGLWQKQGSANGGAYVSIILFAMCVKQRRWQRGQERHISGANCIVFFRPYPRIVILSGVARALCGLRSRRACPEPAEGIPKKPAFPILFRPISTRSSVAEAAWDEKVQTAWSRPKSSGFLRQAQDRFFDSGSRKVRGLL